MENGEVKGNNYFLSAREIGILYSDNKVRYLYEIEGHLNGDPFFAELSLGKRGFVNNNETNKGLQTTSQEFTKELSDLLLFAIETKLKR